jgi:hypothetical protein
VEIALDVGQPDADHGVVEEGEEQDPAQRGERKGLGRRTEATLLDIESSRRALNPDNPGDPLRHERQPPSSSARPSGRIRRFMNTSFAYPRGG